MNNMAVAGMRAIIGTAAMLHYCLNPEAHKDDENYEPSERVQHVQSTLLAGKENEKAMVDELHLQKGISYESNHLRISLLPGEDLTDENKDKFVNEIMEKYLPGRNFIAIWHGDTDHLHVHILAQFLSNDLKPLSFGGQGKHREAIRQQNIIDNACKKFGLSVVERNEDRYNTSQERRGIQESRLRDRKKYVFKDDLRQRINNSMLKSKNINTFIQNLKENGVDARITGRGISYKFVDQGGKERLCKGMTLGNSYSLGHIKDVVQGRMAAPQYREYDPSHTTSSPVSSVSTPSGASSSGVSAPVIAGSAGKASEEATKEEQEAQVNNARNQQQILSQINRTLQERLSEEQTKKKGIGMSR